MGTDIRLDEQARDHLIKWPAMRLRSSTPRTGRQHSPGKGLIHITLEVAGRSAPGGALR
jgi:hypothetical protein